MKKKLLNLLIVGGILASAATVTAGEVSLWSMSSNSISKTAAGFGLKPIPRLFNKSLIARPISFQIPPAPSALGGDANSPAPLLLPPPTSDPLMAVTRY